MIRAAEGSVATVGWRRGWSSSLSPFPSSALSLRPLCPIGEPQASPGFARNLFGGRCRPGKDAPHASQTHWVPFLAGMSPGEDNVKSWCFPLELWGGGGRLSRLQPAQGRRLGCSPAEFHFHFFIEKSKSGELEPFHIDSSGASENYILCRTKKAPRRVVTEPTPG